MEQHALPFQDLFVILATSCKTMFVLELNLQHVLMVLSMDQFVSVFQQETVLLAIDGVEAHVNQLFKSTAPLDTLLTGHLVFYKVKLDAAEVLGMDPLVSL